ncbi:MAG: hypothetical protein DHS20C17_34640 [Cyclobacteriaceae bacterium]|nr:MAG: hypothetical protein DHS20C17_34640 [Cyclobacteriaceae bacterium]
MLDDNGCQAETAVEIIENTNPTVEISGDESYCVGDSTALDAGLFVSYLWSTTEETQSIDASQPGTYEVEVVDDNGCTGSGSIEISELALPEPQIEGLLSFCDGGSTTLSTGTFEGYEWSTGGMTAEVSVMQTGTFSVTVEDTNGCFGTSSVEVMEAEDIQFEITGELTFCDGDSTQLNAGDFETYEWSTGDMTSTIMANSSGTYDVTVTNSGGCTGESSIVVQENDPLNVNIAGQANFCEGTTTSLTVDIGFDTYIWSNDATGNNIEVEEGGTYMVTVTDDTGCSGMASLEVSETPAPLPVISGELSICEGEPTSLNVGDFETYLWSDGTNAATLETSTAGLFSVTVTDQNGCTGETAATVEAASQPQAEILGASNGICIGESIELMAFGEGAYTWIDTDGTLTVISSDLAVASPANAVTYGLIVSNNCFSDTTFLELQIFDSPLIDAGSDVIVKVGEEVRLEASGASAYEWSGGNFLSCTACAGPIATPDSTTTFIATGIDANGCQGIDSVRVTVLSEDVKLVDAVNAFTPNNDGVNDFFAIKDIEQFSDHKLTIFNRWGDTVYESLDYQNDWDGTYNGELLPAGTYLYVLVINALGEKQVIKSTITIVRE